MFSYGHRFHFKMSFSQILCRIQKSKPALDRTKDETVGRDFSEQSEMRENAHVEVFF